MRLLSVIFPAQDGKGLDGRFDINLTSNYTYPCTAYMSNTQYNNLLKGREANHKGAIEVL